MGKTIIGAAGRVVGPSGSWRRRWALLISLAIGLGASTLIIQAVHEAGGIELDGDADSNGGTPGDDWDVIEDGTATEPDETEFSEELNLNSSIFTGGGSKDPSDISEWAWKDDAGGLPDKDNLLHSFAAQYTLPITTDCPAPAPSTTCEVLYFGADRYDGSGDAQMGFWFLQSAVGTRYDSDEDGDVDDEDDICAISIGGATGFCKPDGTAATHEVGDVLVLTNFSNGGSTSTIRVLSWDPPRQVPGTDPPVFVGCTATGKKIDPSGKGTLSDPNCADTNLRSLASVANADCDLVPVGTAFCGIVNKATTANPPGPGNITLPWEFLNKTGDAGNVARPGEFYEAGLNLSTLGLADRCFASVVAETRSATSTTAQLKDFIVGALGSCTTTLVTTPKDGAGANLPLDPVPPSLLRRISIGTGSVQVTDSAVLTVTGASTFSGTLTFHLCGPNSTVPNCATGGTLIDTQTPITANGTYVSAAATITSAGTYCWRATFTATTEGVPDATDATAGECFIVIPVPPAVTTDATADPPTGLALGQSISDTATLSGAASDPDGSAADGTITFKLYGPFATLAEIDSTACTVAKEIAAATSVKNVSGNGSYVSNSFTPTAVGYYAWIATYSGDSPNTSGPVSGGCGDTNEVSFIFALTPTVSTAQFFYPNDRATVVVGNGGGDLQGNVRFRMFTTSDCSNAASIDQTVDVTTGLGTGQSKTVKTTNTTVEVGAGSVYWWVSYDSTKSAHVDVPGFCGMETSTITVNDSVTPPAPPS